MISNTFPVNFIKPGMILYFRKVFSAKSLALILGEELIDKFFKGIRNLDIIYKIKVNLAILDSFKESFLVWLIEGSNSEN